MKRYVKELQKDLKNNLIRLGSERSKEYLEADLKLEKILNMAERGMITDVEAVRSMIDCYYAETAEG